MSEVRCRRCNRVLTNPKSISRGFGPVCWRRIHGGRVNVKSRRGWRTNVKQKSRIKSLVEVFCVKAQTPAPISPKITMKGHEVK